MIKRPVVSVIKTKPETVLEDYGELMRLADYQKAIKKSKETILKLNLSWSLYFPACSTQPWQLDGVVKTLQEDGYQKLHPVENRTVVTDVWKGAEGNKWLPVLKKYGLTYEPLTETKWVRYQAKADLPALAELFGERHTIPETFIGKNVIHLPTLKTHGHTMMTGAMKNAFGGLITTMRHHSHKIIDEVLVDLLTLQQEIHPGMFAVMDGTVAGDGAGPRTMIPKTKNILLASADQVAIDATAAHLMGYDPLKIKFIKMAHDQGLGMGDVDQIDYAGMSKREVLRTNYQFTTKKSPVIFWDQTLRKKYPLFEKVIFHTSLFKLPIFLSYFYHDKVWYPTIGKSRIRTFKHTPWGALWKTY